MGRRVTVGVLPGGVGLLSISENTITSVNTDTNLQITADGNGIVEILKSVNITSGDLTINSQGDVRLRDSGNTAYVGIQAPATVSSTYTITLPSAAPSRNGYVLASTTAGVTTWEPAQSFAYSVESTSFSAVAYGAYFVNTSSGGVTATLPASPSIGDTIRFFDVAKTFDTNAFTVARNGQLIQGDAENLTVSTESAAFELVYSNSTFGWRIFSI